MSDHNVKGIVFAVITALCWSMVPVALKMSVKEVPPATVVWFRFTLAFFLLFSYTAIQAPRRLEIIYKAPILLMVAAIALGCNYLGILLGVKNTTPSTTQVVIQLGPVLLAFAGFIIYKEKITRLKVVGFIIAVSGLVLFYFKQAALLVDEIKVFNIGILWTIFAAVAWAVYAVLQKRLLWKYSTQQLNLLIFGLPALLYVPFVDFEVFPQISALSWGVLLFLGLNTFVAYASMSEALKYTQANKVSIIITLNPIVTFIIMALVGYYGAEWIEHESFTPASLIGALFVLTGAVIVVGLKNPKKGK